MIKTVNRVALVSTLMLAIRYLIYSQAISPQENEFFVLRYDSVTAGTTNARALVVFNLLDVYTVARRLHSSPCTGIKVITRNHKQRGV